MSDLSSVNGSVSSSVFDVVRNVFGRIIDAFGAVETGVRRRNAYLELSELSDEELADRGLTRADIVGYVFDNVH
ncbi:DUF1127 domain-containing protein [Tropicimonas aquimaris]|uniref:DUF1127 domain-containing protein n=1 Tax=Tropicimonas aquimaris TaxID=914152 RepID=A0ABW3IM99_9RHOB